MSRFQKGLFQIHSRGLVVEAAATSTSDADSSVDGGKSTVKFEAFRFIFFPTRESSRTSFFLDSYFSRPLFACDFYFLSFRLPCSVFNFLFFRTKTQLGPEDFEWYRT